MTPAETDLLQVEVTMQPGELTPGTPHAFTVEITAAEGWSPTDAGIPGVFVQLDVPSSVSLVGKVLETRQELARNEFLVAPFERLVETGATEIAFTIDRVPPPDATIGVNVVAYVRGPAAVDGGKGEARFVRQRFSLPVRAGAVAVPADASRSTWGGERGGLQIGDHADPFSLPRADGSEVTLQELLDRSNAIVTTYRAHW
jgi:hypothetical protein